MINIYYIYHNNNHNIYNTIIFLYLFIYLFVKNSKTNIGFNFLLLLIGRTWAGIDFGWQKISNQYFHSHMCYLMKTTLLLILKRCKRHPEGFLCSIKLQLETCLFSISVTRFQCFQARYVYWSALTIRYQTITKRFFTSCISYFISNF